MESKPNISNYSIDVITWLAYDERKNKFTGISMDDVLNEISAIFEESPVMIKSKSRKRRYLFCRYIASYVIYSLISTTLEEIGLFFGDRDHSTILEANAKVRQWIKDKDPAFYEYWLNYTENSIIWKRYSKKLPIL